MTKFTIIYITIDKRELAIKIAKLLVKEKLAACVNIFPIESLYSWRGKIERTREFGMFVKTKKELFKKLTERLTRIHPYEIPCIIELPIQRGYKKFLNWIEKTTKNKFERSKIKK